MDDLTKAQLFAAVRAILYIGGTVAVSLGHHWPDDATVSEITGAATVVIAFVWSLIEKNQRHGGTAAPSVTAQPQGEQK